MLANFDHNSVLRPRIVQWLTVGVPVKLAAIDLDLNERTIRRAHTVDPTILNLFQSIPNQKKSSSVNYSSLTIAEEFANEAIPVLSGRDYRVCKYTRDKLYALYLSYCHERQAEPMGKTSFFEHFINHEKIRWSQDTTICTYCEENKEIKKIQETNALNLIQQKTLEKTNKHIEKWYEMSLFYKSVKLQVMNNQRPGEVMVVQDFTQIKVQSTFYQDLIICFYFYQTNFERRYFHFVGQSKETKNNIDFVVAVWKLMVQDDFFRDFTKLLVFSDGGPKHFKISSNMSFFAAVQEKLGKPVEHYFFESNHGHSVCDAVASQAKKKLSESQRNEGIGIHTPLDITSVINELTSHVALIAPIDINVTAIQTFHGIRSLYKWTFDEDFVYGFSSPADLQFKKKYSRPSFNFFE